MTGKEQIMIDGVDVSGCKYLPYCEDKQGNCGNNPNCYYKQLQKEKFENLNNRQMVESAENLIYENSELYKNLKEKEQEFDLFKSNEDMLISALQLVWGKQIAEEQGDCKNIDYRKPITTKIYKKISELQETLKDVAFAQSVSMGKTKPLGDTGSPKSYKRWEKRQRELLTKEIKWY